eukprot:353783-Chlamydomonas_euryale.AAC.3
MSEASGEVGLADGSARQPQVQGKTDSRRENWISIRRPRGGKKAEVGRATRARHKRMRCPASFLGRWNTYCSLLNTFFPRPSNTYVVKSLHRKARRKAEFRSLAVTMVTTAYSSLFQ